MLAIFFVSLCGAPQPLAANPGRHRLEDFVHHRMTRAAALSIIGQAVDMEMLRFPGYIRAILCFCCVE